MSTSIKRSLSKTIEAPAERVFDSWLIPAVVGRWMFNTDLQSETLVELNNKVRPKGDFDFRVTRGGKPVAITGEYHVIDRPVRLEFSWRENEGPESTVLARFEAFDNCTHVRLVLTLDAALGDEADRIKKLWTQRCNKLAQLLAK
jgi:uncharacterized protein YndB with AHSA1/START domain